MSRRDPIPVAVVRRVRAAARNRCGYCLSPQHLVMGRLHLDHVTPLADGGTDDETNLWLSCSICNGHKSDKTSGVDPLTAESVKLFHPRHQKWSDHFEWSEDGLRVHGLTPTGRATVSALRLDDDPDAVIVRGYWVIAGWHPPTESDI